MKKKAKPAAKPKKSVASGLKSANKADFGKVKVQKSMKNIKEPC